MNCPTISLLLPIRNEAQYIQRTLDSILAQDYPSEKIEILIADGMSTDRTREIVQTYQQQHRNISLYDNPKQIVPTGLNLLIPQAKGDILIRVDGHTVLEPGYVRACVDALTRTGADNVGGRMNASGENYFGEVVALATSSPFGVGGARFHYSQKEEWVDTVYMGAWKKETFTKIGLFDEELVRDQDDEFNYRLRAYGGKILLSPAIRSHYTVRGSPRKLWRQYFQYGYWKVRVMQKHPRQMRPRQFVPAVFVLGLIFSIILSFLHPWGFYLLLSIAGMYLLANLAASLITALRTQLRFLPLLPIIFTILHFSYGIGFLAGLVKFWQRWGDNIFCQP